MAWRMLDLFSGIGGFSLAAQWVWGDDLEIVAFCEIDKFCQRVLRKNFSEDILIIEDIKKVEWVVADTKCNRCNGSTISVPIRQSQQEGSMLTWGNFTISPIDLLTGGFPCQPFSHAGKRAGTEDNRYLWPEMLRAIHEVKPRWVVAENVPGILSLDSGMVFKGVLSDLETEGYEVIPLVIPACAVGAPHRRDRVWVVAFKSNKGRFNNSLSISKSIRCRMETKFKRTDCYAPDTNSRSTTKGFWQEHWYEVATRFCRVDDGVPRRVDRLKSLGNAIVPQVAEQIFRAIKETESTKGLKVRNYEQNGMEEMEAGHTLES